MKTLDIRKAAKDYLKFIDGISKGKYILENLVMSVAELLAELKLDQNEQLVKGCAKVFPVNLM